MSEMTKKQIKKGLKLFKLQSEYYEALEKKKKKKKIKKLEESGGRVEAYVWGTNKEDEFIIRSGLRTDKRFKNEITADESEFVKEGNYLLVNERLYRVLR